MSSMSAGFDWGSHWTKAGIIEEESGQFRLIYKKRSIFAFDRNISEVPIFGQDALKADSNKIIADANRDHKFATINETVPFRCYANYDRQNHGTYQLALNNTAETYAVGQQAVIAANLAHVKEELMKLEQFKACQECHAVIAVPSFASDNHRRVMDEAVQLFGGFKSVQFINQSTAALIAYNFDQQQAQNCGKNQQVNVGDQQQLIGLICFGANSFECSLFHAFDANDDVFSPKLVATAGTTEFGSAAFTDQLAKWCLAKIDPNGNNLVMNARKHIWEECEKAKQRLSEQESTKIHLHYPYGVPIDVQRAGFERLCQPLLGKLGQLVIKRIFGPNRGKIGRLVLVGEGCSMPALMRMVGPYLAMNCVKVEGALGDWVVKGAAIKARAMEKQRQGENNSPFEDLLYRQVNLAFPMMAVAGGGGAGLMNLFKPGMQIPTGESQRFEYGSGNVKFLLEEDGLQMGKFVVVRHNYADNFNQITFRISRNGQLQARLYNSLGQHKELDLLACLSNWSNLYGNAGLHLMREELTKLSILPRANANSNDRTPNLDWDDLKEFGARICDLAETIGGLSGLLKYEEQAKMDEGREQMRLLQGTSASSSILLPPPSPPPPPLHLPPPDSSSDSSDSDTSPTTKDPDRGRPPPRRPCNQQQQQQNVPRHNHGLGHIVRTVVLDAAPLALDAAPLARSAASLAGGAAQLARGVAQLLLGGSGSGTPLALPP